MPVLICPRCKHFNPEYAIYCHFDGVVLQAQQNALALRLPGDFVFPSGRRCQTFDDLAQGCQEEWTAARDLLSRGVFSQYFRKSQRADLVRAADDAKAQTNPDMALMTFLTSLPGTRTQTPKLDLNPRRVLLGALTVGESKSVALTISNQGQGVLQGTVSVTEGQDWLSLSPTGPIHEIEITTVREQAITLTVNTKGLAAGQTYAARLTVVTNGGVVEVPLRMDLLAQAFTKAPFQGVRSQREFAERARQQPKVAVPILESGEVQRWFTLNGWTYPVPGTPIKGVGGVQQFFEGMGLSKPPAVQLSQSEFRFTCKHKDTIKGQATLQTNVKKWVYAQVSSDVPWLKPGLAQVSGPQQATVPFEIDTGLWNLGPSGEGKLSLIANGGQKLSLRILLEVQSLPALQNARPDFGPTSTSVPPAAFAAGPPPAAHWADGHQSIEIPTSKLKYVPALVTTVLLFLVVRLVMVPAADCIARPLAANAAADRLGVKPTPDGAVAEWGGWLHLPWLEILGGAEGTIPVSKFQPGSKDEMNMAEFRHYFVSYFIRGFVLATFWIGAVGGAIMVYMRGGSTRDMPWGILAGAGAGFALCATVTSFYLVAEIIPHAVWHLTIGPRGGFGFLVLWAIMAVFCWICLGIGLGIVLPLITPLRRIMIDPIQAAAAWLLRILGMPRLALYWTPFAA